MGRFDGPLPPRPARFGPNQAGQAGLGLLLTIGSNDDRREGVESPMSFERGLHISVNTVNTNNTVKNIEIYLKYHLPLRPCNT